MNSLVLVGRLTKDPELRYIPGAGTAVASFTIAVDRDFVKRCSKVHVWAKPGKTEKVETQEQVKEQESYGAVDFDDVPF